MMADKMRLPGANPSLLMPVSGTLAPPTGSGSLLNMSTGGGAELAQEVSAQLGRAGGEARKLASHAAALAAEKAPEIRRRAAIASAVVSNLAGKAIHEAGVSAQAASAIMADPEQRQAAFARNRKTLGIGLAIAVVVVGGGWALAKHEATATAKDRLDAVLIRYNLQNRVTYQDISASPFGSVTLSDVKVGVSPRDIIKIASLDISDIRMDGDRITGLSLNATTAELPLLDMARQGFRTSGAIEAVGLGYTTLAGNVALSVHSDEQRGILSIQTSGDVRDAGKWDASVEFGGISTGFSSSLYGAAQAMNQNNPLAMGYGQIQPVLGAIGGLTLNQARIMVDDSGVLARSLEISDAALPPEEGHLRRIPSINENQLVRAGISPSAAQKIKNSLDSWINDGGSLRVETNLDHPLPLFTNGNPFTPAFGDPGQFLAVTKSSVSD